MAEARLALCTSKVRRKSLAEEVWVWEAWRWPVRICSLCIGMLFRTEWPFV